MSRVRNIVFDCNESILDLATVTPVFQRLFGEPGAMRLWFRELITYSQALTIANVYVPFTDIGGAVLEKIAAPRQNHSGRPHRAHRSVRHHAAVPRRPGGPAAVEAGRLPSFYPDGQHSSHLRAPVDPWWDN